MTGYRVAVVAGLPRQMVYPEIRRGLAAKLIEAVDGGKLRFSDPDLRDLLRKRVRISWSEDWDEARRGWAEETPRLLTEDLAELRTKLAANPEYLRPKGWKPSRRTLRIIREMERPPEKDATLRRAGLRTSLREDWARER